MLNVVVQQGDKQVDLLIDFEGAAIYTASTQIPQTQVSAWAVICSRLLLMYLTKDISSSYFYSHSS